MMKLKTFVSTLAFALCLGLTACGGDEPDAPDTPATTPSEKPSGGNSGGGGSNDSDDSQYLASGKCGANITWTLDEYGTLELTGKGKMNDYSTASAPWSKWSEKVIKKVRIANGITSIGNGTFSMCFKLSSVSIPNSVTTIGRCAFLGSELKDVELPNSVKSIGASAFEGCGFSSITIPSGVTVIEERTFLGCEKLSSVTIPNGVTSIDKCAFAHCYRLASVTISSSVTAIGDGAFYECGKLNQVTCMATNPPTCYPTTYLNYGTFDNLSYIIRHLKVPSSAVSKYKSADVWKKFKSITGI